MGVDDFFYNRQTKTCSLTVFSAWTVLFVKTFPYFTQIFFWDTGTVILDGHKDGTSFFCSLNRDGRFIAAELDGVIQEVIENLLNLFHIRCDIEMFTGQNQFD